MSTWIHKVAHSALACGGQCSLSSLAVFFHPASPAQASNQLLPNEISARFSDLRLIFTATNIKQGALDSESRVSLFAVARKLFHCLAAQFFWA